MSQQQMGGHSLADLVSQMEQSAEDPRRCYALVRQRIAEMRNAGEIVPDEMVRLERSLMTECLAESQGR